MTTKSKRPAKFGHLKVGDEVVTVHCRRGPLVGTVVESKPGYFWAAFTCNGIRLEYAFLKSTGVGKRFKNCSFSGMKALFVPEFEGIDEIRKGQERGNLLESIRKAEFDGLTLPQLRRIRDELDAAGKGAGE